MSYERQQQVKCACPRLDAGDCVDFRSGYDMRLLFGDVSELSSGELCECMCHDDEGYDADDEGYDADDDAPGTRDGEGG